MQTSLPKIVIQAHAPLISDDFISFFDELDNHEITHQFEQKEPGMYASLEWLIPTGIALYITKSYFDGLFKEIGKDHYQWIKKSFSNIYCKALGSEPEFEYKIFSAGKQKMPVYFSGNLSIVYSTQSGSKIKLLFPLDITHDDYTNSCEQFFRLLESYETGMLDNSLSAEIEIQIAQKMQLLPSEFAFKQKVTPSISILIYWDQNHETFYIADPIVSSKTKTLVSRKLGVL
ncbi:MAG: hypothetical protein HOP25_00355 [Methylotenera sp.]|nr:hypothetical protein [Methylotenera sp.]